jgi:hypothetical protein
MSARKRRRGGSIRQGQLVLWETVLVLEEYLTATVKNDPKRKQVQEITKLATALQQTLHTYARISETAELEQRIQALEDQQQKQGRKWAA